MHPLDPSFPQVVPTFLSGDKPQRPGPHPRAPLDPVALAQGVHSGPPGKVEGTWESGFSMRGGPSGISECLSRPQPGPHHERRAQRACGPLCSHLLGTRPQGHGLPGLGSPQLPGTGHLQPPLRAGALLEETLPEQGQAKGLQPDICPPLGLCHGEWKHVVGNTASKVGFCSPKSCDASGSKAHPLGPASSQDGPLGSLCPETSLEVQGLRLHSQCRGAWVQSLVRELDPTGCNLRSHVLQIRPLPHPHPPIKVSAQVPPPPRGLVLQQEGRPGAPRGVPKPSEGPQEFGNVSRDCRTGRFAQCNPAGHTHAPHPRSDEVELLA